MCVLMFLTELFTVVKRWEQLKCPWMDKWVKQEVTYICSEILFSLRKQENSDNMKEAWGHCTEGNKPVTKEPVLYNST